MFDRNYCRAINPATNSPWAYHIACFSDEECDKIIEQGSRLEIIQANLGTERNIEKNLRNNTVGFFSPKTPDHEWIYTKLIEQVRHFNNLFWKFDLTFIECVQFTRYDKTGNFYGSHMDIFYDPLEVRKLSVSVQLSDPNTYKGSELCMFRRGTEWDPAPKQRGTIVVFPSYHVHQVTPLEEGERYSLVSWVAGPPFK